MSVYCTSLFISLCCNACVSLYSCVLLILLNGFDRVAWLVLLFESVSDSNGRFSLLVHVKISTQPCKVVGLSPSMYVYMGLSLLCVAGTYSTHLLSL